MEGREEDGRPLTIASSGYLEGFEDPRDLLGIEVDLLCISVSPTLL